MPIKDHDVKPAKIRDSIYTVGGDQYHHVRKVNMERALFNERLNRMRRKMMAKCWDCGNFINCNRTEDSCKINFNEDEK